MKKVLPIVFVMLMLLVLPAKAEEFVQIHVPYLYSGAGEILRYADDKTPIALSENYDGYMHAIIPERYKDRAVEAFYPEEIIFADYNEEYWGDFYDFECLYQRGVIKGDESGSARPYDNVTRAEATAMVMRMLGLENEDGLTITFEDVKKTDWFYSVVATAKKHGIVEGDSETVFSPHRNVTHEEIVVMMARAVKCANLAVGSDGYMIFRDIDEVSAWAKDAYEILGDVAPVKFEFEVTDDGRYIEYGQLEPKEDAERRYVAELIYNLIYDQVYPSQAAMKYGFDNNMPVVDGSTSTYPFTRELYYKLFSNGQYHKDMPKSHSKTSASYERLINGEVDAVFAGVIPGSSVLEMAKEKGVEIELVPIAYEAMVFFTNEDNEIEGLTSEQIKDIYVNNAYSNWSEIGGEDKELIPYCRNNDSGSHGLMERYFLEGNEIHADVQREASGSMSDILIDVSYINEKHEDAYGLGYSVYYYFQNATEYSRWSGLKLLKIDGIEPNDKTIADGTYPLSDYAYLAIRADEPEDSPARHLVDFMLSDEGQECVEDAGFGALDYSERALRSS